VPFDIFPPKMQAVAKAGQRYLIDRFGKAGIKLEEELHPDIAWRPTIQVRPNKALIVAAEVSDSLNPGALKLAAIDVLRFDFPISMYLVCPLDIYLADKGQKVTGQLRRHGFGILTVDDDGKVVSQCPCIPLAQFLSEEEMAPSLANMNPKLRVFFKGAHDTYRTNEGQGLQACGQIVEAVIRGLGKAAANKGLIAAPTANAPTADIIDELYAHAAFKNHRAALGGARSFIKGYRNVASHPATTAKDAIQKIRKCKAGFMDALRIGKELGDVITDKKYRLEINIT
jgi:hypothetical protein